MFAKWSPQATPADCGGKEALTLMNRKWSSLFTFSLLRKDYEILTFWLIFNLKMVYFSFLAFLIFWRPGIDVQIIRKLGVQVI